VRTLRLIVVRMGEDVGKDLEGARQGPYGSVAIPAGPVGPRETAARELTERPIISQTGACSSCPHSPLT